MELQILFLHKTLDMLKNRGKNCSAMSLPFSSSFSECVVWVVDFARLVLKPGFCERDIECKLELNGTYCFIHKSIENSVV